MKEHRVEDHDHIDKASQDELKTLILDETLHDMDPTAYPYTIAIVSGVALLIFGLFFLIRRAIGARK